MAKRSATLTIVGVAVLSSAITTAVLWGLGSAFGPRTEVQSPSSVNQIAGTPQEDQTIAVVQRAQPAVVAISISANPNKSKQTTANSVRVAGGSGFFVTSDGLVVTNKHVVQNELFGTNVVYSVRTNEGKDYPAKLAATDPSLDLAFLKVEGTGFPFLNFGNSDQVKAGQTVIAIGNALDEFQNTVTLGIVSGVNRRVVAGDGNQSEIIDEAIQTDAAINPGNSGGPLLDLSGNVIGVNTAISDRGQLLGFAIPANAANQVAQQVRVTGRIIRPFLGVRYLMVTPELAKEEKLSVDFGALVAQGQNVGETAISSGSPAEKVGLREGDILLELDGQRIDEQHTLATLVSKHQVGDEVTIKYLRDGKEATVKVKLEELKV